MRLIPFIVVFAGHDSDEPVFDPVKTELLKPAEDFEDQEPASGDLRRSRLSSSLRDDDFTESRKGETVGVTDKDYYQKGRTRTRRIYQRL